MSIKNLDQLRDFALRSLEELAKGKIDVEEAGARSKLMENVVSGVKLQLQYATLVGRQPKIDFVGKCIAEEKSISIQKRLKIVNEQ